MSLDDIIKITDISGKLLPDPKTFLPDPIKKLGAGITLSNILDITRYYETN